MNYKKWISLSMLSFFLMITMINFQNCSPKNTSSGGFHQDDELRIADEWSDLKVAFVEDLIMTKSNAEQVNFDGLCTSLNDGQAIQWKISTGVHTIQSGEAHCTRGGFRVQTQELSYLNCKKDYYLMAHAKGEADEVIIQRMCAPKSSISDHTKHLSGTQCYYEITDEENCHHNCYRDGKLYKHNPSQGCT